jgi:hypothetical protein
VVVSNESALVRAHLHCTRAGGGLFFLLPASFYFSGTQCFWGCIALTLLSISMGGQI